MCSAGFVPNEEKSLWTSANKAWSTCYFKIFFQQRKLEARLLKTAIKTTAAVFWVENVKIWWRSDVYPEEGIFFYEKQYCNLFREKIKPTTARY
jgi:hypothetical protein